MHSAPSVIYPVGRSRDARRLLLLVWALGLVAVTLASTASAGFDWRQAMLALSAVVAGAAAWTGLMQSSAPGELRFDGAHWSMTGGSGLDLRAARAVVALDLQSLMLVRLDADDRGRHWVWVDRHAMPDRWLDLRRALHARAAVAAAGTDAATAHHRGV